MLTTAEQIALNTQGAAQVVEVARRCAIAMEKNWLTGAMSWTFEDGSRLTVAGPSVTAETRRTA